MGTRGRHRRFQGLGHAEEVGSDLRPLLQVRAAHRLCADNTEPLQSTVYDADSQQQVVWVCWQPLHGISGRAVKGAGVRQIWQRAACSGACLHIQAVRVLTALAMRTVAGI